jgi:VIT1/CCC1 family predicted Fe2+/Mn2+ transporter
VSKINKDQFRNLIFGAEDSLVSTLGVLFGIASAGEFNRHQILIAGIIAIVVEATSMGAGSFLSESTAEEFDGEESKKSNPITDGLIMFLSYFIAGFVPLTPFIFFEPDAAKFVAIGASLSSLFVLGYVPAKNFRSGLKMSAVAGLAAVIGFIVAHIFSV